MSVGGDVCTRDFSSLVFGGFELICLASNHTIVSVGATLITNLLCVYHRFFIFFLLTTFTMLPYYMYHLTCSHPILVC